MTALLESPSHAVVGTADLARSCQFLETFGFVRTAQAEIDAQHAWHLYGLDGPTSVARLAVPGAERGWIRLVETPHPPRAHGPYDHRPVAVDLYTRDIDQSIALARSAGATVGRLVGYEVGPLVLREVETRDADGLDLVFIEVNRRRPSVLDHDPERLHSEVHSIVFSVPSAERSLETWRDRAGLDVLVDAPIRGPVISELMDLPRPGVPIRFVLLCDDDARPARLETIEFPEDEGATFASRPLHAGLHAVGFEVASLDTARQVLAPARFEPATAFDDPFHGRARAVAGTTVDGLAFELWEAC